jgi:hypothetical protein
VVDGTNDIFNNELWAPNGGINVANNGVFVLNRSGGFGAPGNAILNAWIAYNNDPNADPLNPPSSANATHGPWVGVGGGSRLATDAELAAVTGITNCDHTNYHQVAACRHNDPATGGIMNWPGGQTDTYHALQDITGANNNGGAPPNNGYTAVEYQKVILLQKRAAGAECAFIPRPNPSGMKKFDPQGCYNTPAVQANFGVPGSPLDYLQQITDGGHITSVPAGTTNCEGTMLNLITNRITQADPSITPTQVRAALGSRQLPLGATLFLYSPGPGAIELVPGTPGAYFVDNSVVSAVDGANSSLVFSCESNYRIDGTLVNATKGRGAGPTCSLGDAHYHASPFTQNPSLSASDRVIYTPASGWRNILGDINFVNDAEDSGTFCKPN